LKRNIRYLFLLSLIIILFLLPFIALADDSLSVSPSHEGDFEETFDSLDDWYLVVYDNTGGSSNDPEPQLDSSMGQPAPSLDVNGNSWCGNGAYSKKTFDYSKGLTIEFDMYVSSGYDWNWGRGGLSDHHPNLDAPRNDGAYVDNKKCGTTYLAYVYFLDDGDYDKTLPSLRFGINAKDGTLVEYEYSSDASKYQNKWHTYKIEIQQGGYVNFFMDEDFIWKSNKTINQSLGALPLLFGDRDANGPVRIDNVKVSYIGLSIIEIVLIVSTAAGTTLLVFVGATGLGKYKFLTFLSLIGPLYIRTVRADVFNNEKRLNMYNHIAENQPVVYSDIRKACNLSHGEIHWHSRMMEQMNLIHVERKGVNLFFKVSGQRLPDEKFIRLTDVQKNIINLIKGKEGITQAEISEKLNIKQQNISYNLLKLEEKNQIKFTKKNRVKYYQLT